MIVLQQYGFLYLMGSLDTITKSLDIASKAPLKMVTLIKLTKILQFISPLE